MRFKLKTVNKFRKSIFDSRGWWGVVNEGWDIPKVFYPLFKSFLPLTCLKKIFNWTNDIVLSIDHRRFGNIEKRLKLFSENWTFIFLVNILSILGSLYFSDVGAEKNCNFTNSSLMFIFIFGNVIHDVFTLMETIRRWDFEYFDLSWIHFFLMWHSKYVSIPRWYFQIFHFHSINDYRIDIQTEDNTQNRG